MMVESLVKTPISEFEETMSVLIDDNANEAGIDAKPELRF